MLIHSLQMEAHIVDVKIIRHLPTTSNRMPRRVLAGGIGVMLVLLAAVSLRQVSGVPFGADALWQTLMASNQWVPAHKVATALAYVGSSTGASVLTGGVVVCLLIFRRWRSAIRLAAAVALGAVASTAIKLVSARPRPGGGIAHLTSFSFPSGHTTWAAAFAAALVLGIPRLWTIILGSGWIAFMAWSRTYLGVHWLSDVFAGALLGISLALIVDGLLTRCGGRLIWLTRSR